MKSITVFLTLAALLASSALHAGIAIFGELTRQYQTEAGSEIKGSIQLNNRGETVEQYRISLYDYRFSITGGSEYLPAASIPRSNAKWVQITPETGSITPGETVDVAFTISIPSEEDLSGTYWSVLMIDPVYAEPSAPELEDGQHLFQVHQRIRYAIQLVTHIGSDGKADVRIGDKKLITKEGKSIFLLDVINEGTKWIYPHGIVTIFDSQGEIVKEIDLNKARVYPQTSIQHKIDLGELASGQYTIMSVFEGEDETFATQYRINIEDPE